jgi:hypothetical protein
MFASELKGSIFRLVEGLGIGLVKTGAVFEVFPESMAVKFGRYFIVLFIGFFSEDSHWRGIGFFDIAFCEFGIGLAIIVFALL